MAESHTRYRHEQLTVALNKYAYVLLVTAASVIMLALNQTANEPLRHGQVPLEVAVTCFGLSFALGYRNLAWMNVALQANAAISMVQLGTHPGVPDRPHLRQSTEEEAYS